MSTPQPILQTPFFSEQSRVTISPFSTGSTGTNNQPHGPNVNVVYSGEGNLLSQTVGQKQSSVKQSQQLAKSEPSQSTKNGAGENKSSGQYVQSASSHVDRKQTNYYPATTSVSRTSGTPIASSSSVTQTTQSIPSTQSFGQRVTVQSKQQYPTTNVRSSTANQYASSGHTTTYNHRVSFGQNPSTNSAATSTTTVPYSPSVPPFRSTTTTTTYNPTATSYNHQTQAYNGQNHESRSFTQHDNGQSTFSNNQFQVPAKEYLPSADNTRTARTNEQSFGNHGSSTLKLSSSQNYARNSVNTQHDSRQQFTYPVDQVID